MAWIRLYLWLVDVVVALLERACWLAPRELVVEDRDGGESRVCVVSATGRTAAGVSLDVTDEVRMAWWLHHGRVADIVRLAGARHGRPLADLRIRLLGQRDLLLRIDHGRPVDLPAEVHVVHDSVFIDFS